MPRVLVPALLNSKSIRPQVSLTLANSAAIEAGSVTSVGTTSVRGGTAFASRAVSSSLSLRRPARTTVQPSSNSACAEARPMPLPAPVITAIFAGVAIPFLPCRLPVSIASIDCQAASFRDASAADNCHLPVSRLHTRNERRFRPARARDHPARRPAARRPAGWRSPYLDHPRYPAHALCLHCAARPGEPGADDAGGRRDRRAGHPLS